MSGRKRMKTENSKTNMPRQPRPPRDAEVSLMPDMYKALLLNYFASPAGNPFRAHTSAGLNMAGLLDDLHRFLLLKVECGGRHELSPSPLIDQAWHAFMLYPRQYSGYCTECLGHDGPVDHDPMLAYEDTTERLRQTRQQYREYFGGPPSRNFMSEEEQEEGKRVEKGGRGVPMTVFVVGYTGMKVALNTTGSTTISDLKVLYHGKEGIPPDQQRMIFAGKQLEDGQTLDDCSIRDGSSVHLFQRLKGC